MEDHATSLLYTRKPGESVDLTLEDGRTITVTLASIDHSNRARIRITAPRTVRIERSERKTKGEDRSDGI